MKQNSFPQPRTRLPKLCGADIELGNFITGGETGGSTGMFASRLLLEQIHGFPLARSHGRVAYEVQDWGRKYLKENGGCIYIDMDHLELALPEVRRARDHVAAWHAMLRFARRAQEVVNAELPSRRTLEVLVNNSDGQGNSYGSHLDFLISRRAWDEMFVDRLHTLLFLVSFQVSSIVMTGQGKVGSENGRPDVAFQISQRADFFETLMSIETTRRRPLANCRNEALCGGFRSNGHALPPALEMARLHVIFYDNTLCHVASLLKVGVMQIILAMIEAGRVNPALILDNPLEAVGCWSHDPNLTAKAKLIGGEELTAVELQMRFFAEAKAFVEAGECDEFVPGAREILALWGDTLEKLARRDWEALSRRLDWVLKWTLLERAKQQHPGWAWDAPELKTLDLMYGSLRTGLYWACEGAGMIEPVVSAAEIERFTQEPPEDTRAWTRAMLLRMAEPSEVERMDWDELQFRLRDGDGYSSSHTLAMPDPLGFTRAEMKSFFGCTETVAEFLELLEGQTITRRGVVARRPVLSSTRVQTKVYHLPSYSPDANKQEQQP